MTTKQIKLCAAMLEMRDAMKSLYGERWPEVSGPYREIIAGAMEGSGDHNPLSAVIPIAKAMAVRGHNHTMMMAVAFDMAYE